MLVAALATGSCVFGGTGRFIRLDAPIVALTHVRIIDGSGRPGIDDQVIVIQRGRITAAGSPRSVPVPPDARVIDLPGRTVIPGLVGMHDHLFYEVERAGSGTLMVASQSAFAKLYLASGVTTIRTAGTLDLTGDVRLKQRIDHGKEPGPHIYVTGPYLGAAGAEPRPDQTGRQVVDAANAGATSMKAYTTLRSSELGAAIQAAHERGLQVTGHLCAVGFREAVALGIDNLEHGLFVDTEFYSDKEPDQCPNQGAVVHDLSQMDVNGPEIRGLVDNIVRHNVAITSTLAVLETLTGRPSSLDPRALSIFSSGIRSIYVAARDHWSDPNAPLARAWMGMLVKEMQFERAFVAAGGRLLAGVDPTGWGGVVAGFGDQRELELLVDAGLSPETAIKVATSNAAAFLHEKDFGSIAAGMRADVVVVRGNPSRRISDVRNVEMVFKDGVSYDPDALIDATKGTVGEYDLSLLLGWPWNAILGALIAYLAGRILWRATRPFRRQTAREVER